MAKAKAPPGVQNKNIYTRASYLYQAAAFLATASQQPHSRSAPDSSASDADGGAQDATSGPKDATMATPAMESLGSKAPTADQCRALQNMSRSLLADMRAVSLKLLIRQRPEIKRTVCRYCDALLVPGSSCDAAAMVVGYFAPSLTLSSPSTRLAAMNLRRVSHPPHLTM
ncbi:hypothetical protein LLEC1_05776 [Akanthomyces lecanii]|uniref:Uncharacterized protein n=1 Tax=Cordyceps confragosa TaxID=2714763 RepID=A0A179I7C5_CORDF|nr:hypothetical protein LLEC1_05776 [Akanthomyces lecanii]